MPYLAGGSWRGQRWFRRLGARMDPRGASGGGCRVLSYVIAGLVLGSIYALCASGLVVTYVSAGVLNLSFGALAFVIARIYYWLQVQHNWATWQAGLLAIVAGGPILGFALWALIFRYMARATQLTKFA